MKFLKAINKSELQYLHTMPARLLNAVSQNNYIKFYFIDNNKTGYKFLGTKQIKTFNGKYPLMIKNFLLTLHYRIRFSRSNNCSKKALFMLTKFNIFKATNKDNTIYVCVLNILNLF